MCAFRRTSFMHRAICLAFLTLPLCSYASVINTLGTAQNFSLLSLTGGVFQSGTSSVEGAIGVAAAFSGYRGSGSINDPGGFDIRTKSTFQGPGGRAGSLRLGPVHQNAQTDALLLGASAAASSTSTLASTLGLVPTASYGLLQNSTTISETKKGQYVFDLSGINLRGGRKLTLSAPAGSTFVLNVGSRLRGGAFNLSSAQIILTGGLTADDVLFNVLGSGGVNIASSTVNGIVLALNRSVSVTGGAVNGELVGGSISLSGGSVNNPPPVVPEANTFLVLIPFIGAILLSASWRYLRTKGDKAVTARPAAA
jgi:choice-of-anchor A domain-containing protein